MRLGGSSIEFEEQAQGPSSWFAGICSTLSDTCHRMTFISVVAGIALGVTFIVSAVLKIADRPSWIRAAADLGVSRPIARVVPWGELVLGVLLAFRVWSPWVDLIAVGVLLVFTGFIVIRLLDGSRTPCACFGGRSKRPLGAYHVIRNVGLIVLAVIAAIGP